MEIHIHSQLFDVNIHPVVYKVIHIIWLYSYHFNYKFQNCFSSGCHNAITAIPAPSSGYMCYFLFFVEIEDALSAQGKVR